MGVAGALGGTHRGVRPGLRATPDRTAAVGPQQQSGPQQSGSQSYAVVVASIMITSFPRRW
ncbi:hypothetical protein O7632_24220 [Solwaraspora sp. WMMD406]|uniref:hypothetical protein n=1 Tax=Solwaraspora sp. WMMD406 TaxID=3016095 RepID=UPI002417916D|nr:hypothetical protein [Solwaraspora sp. WMMD406]MDG4767180.1 hypothetical protein [Solwaraspora sp. WMMD406]